MEVNPPKKFKVIASMLMPLALAVRLCPSSCIRIEVNSNNAVINPNNQARLGDIWAKEALKSIVNSPRIRIKDGSIYRGIPKIAPTRMPPFMIF
jgi:hypothetical protein